MKNLILYTFLLCFHAGVCYSQKQISVDDCLPVRNTEDAAWIGRYEKEVLELEKKEALATDAGCDALFIGSSSIRMWQTLEDDFAPLRVVNRGYGGASIRDLLYNYHRIIGRYHPERFVFYAENDMTGSATDISVSMTFDLYRLFFERIRRDFPQARLYILSVKPSLSRKNMIPKYRILNELLREYAAETDRCSFVDVAAALLDANGDPNPALFLPDNLHLNNEGYRAWTNILKPYLMTH
ncbi:MAG: GDSL-type esterase/lipase family protein [Tannerellaceae bacterium]|jgi:hypothetical protein|nr:GDSL-type esterase/lipase family protein [Tannerellaceae bacterium]